MGGGLGEEFIFLFFFCLSLNLSISHLAPSPFLLPLLNPLLCSSFHKGSAIAAGGSALVPCQPFGAVFDLVEAVLAHLAAVQIATVPVYFVSPCARASLAYANIFGNWWAEGRGEGGGG